MISALEDVVGPAVAGPQKTERPAPGAAPRQTVAFYSAV
jgi:hypothetical protein